MRQRRRSVRSFRVSREADTSRPRDLLRRVGQRDRGVSRAEFRRRRSSGRRGMQTAREKKNGQRRHARARARQLVIGSQQDDDNESWRVPIGYSNYRYFTDQPCLGREIEKKSKIKKLFSGKKRFLDTAPSKTFARQIFCQFSSAIVFENIRARQTLFHHGFVGIFVARVSVRVTLFRNRYQIKWRKNKNKNHDSKRLERVNRRPNRGEKFKTRDKTRKSVF